MNRELVAAEIQALDRTAHLSHVNGLLSRVVRERGPVGTSPLTWSWAASTLKRSRPEISREEIAAGITYRIFAQHRRSERVPVFGTMRLGQALATMNAADPATRVVQLAQIRSIEGVEEKIRRMIPLTSSVKIDYASLYTDLLLWQNPTKRKEVTARWIRDCSVTLSKKRIQQSGGES